MSNQPILMSDEEPTDAQLRTIMKEVATEATEKALLAKQQSQERIMQEIAKAETRYKAMHT